ncbi:MAG: S-layer homology domain-containing protein [Ruminococcaceae bacterium]|nr:S-layer homology domain-containing protein [Oscillospiraceae bacterium]
MKKHILTTALLLSAMLASQMSLTAAAADTGADDIILISPNPNAAQTETVPDTAGDTAAKNILQTQYEQLAGMYAYDGVASQLYSIGVLLGDGVNFNLLDLPDRQQACVMVVRMRGEEEAAKAAYAAGEVTCPFEDVEDYAKPYIAWLYDKGITKGVGGGKFGNAICSAQEYVTFMLRALGYTVTWGTEDGTDVLYADALAFASDLNLWDERLANEPAFNRGVMSAVTYQTLAADVKGEENRLLSVLAQVGAVDADKAQPILDLYDKVDAAAVLELASVPLVGGAMKLTGEMVQEELHVFSALGTPEGDITEEAYGGLTFDVGLDFTEGKTEFAVEGAMQVTASDMDVTIPMGVWFTDGTVYVDIMGEKEKADAAEIGSLDILTTAFGDLSLMFEDTGFQYYTITDVAVNVLEAEDGSGVSATEIVYDATDFMWPIVLAQTDTTGFTDAASLTVFVTTKKLLDADGVLSSVYNRMFAEVSETDAETGIELVSQTLLDSSVTYTAWGDEAVLTFPDFSQFEDAPAEAEQSN